MFSKICLGEYIIPECDEETRMIVTGLLQVKPEKRISLETIFSMHWVQTGDETVDEEEDDVLDRNGPFVA